MVRSKNKIQKLINSRIELSSNKLFPNLYNNIDFETTFVKVLAPSFRCIIIMDTYQFLMFLIRGAKKMNRKDKLLVRIQKILTKPKRKSKSDTLVSKKRVRQTTNNG